MTTPEPHGYPDWGRFVASADKLYDRVNLFNQLAQVTRGPYFVGDVPYVGFHISIQNAGCSVSVVWSQDAAAATVLWTDRIEFSSFTLTDIVLPVKGPFLSIRFTPVATPYDIILTVTSRHTPGRPLQQDTLGNVPISSEFVPANPGVAVVLLSSVIYPGPAVWTIETGLAAFRASVGTIDSAGVIRRADIVTELSKERSRRVFLPAATIRIGFTNNTAAAGTFDTFVSVDPLYGGY